MLSTQKAVVSLLPPGEYPLLRQVYVSRRVSLVTIKYASFRKISRSLGENTGETVKKHVLIPVSPEETPDLKHGELLIEAQIAGVE